MLTAQKASPCMSVTGAIGLGLGPIFLAVSFWIRRKRRFSRSRRPANSGRFVLPPERAAPPNAAEVVVWRDGSARELTEAQKKKYAETEFLPLDGRRPYIKSRYEQRNVRGKLSGPCSGRMCRTAGHQSRNA